VAHSKEFREGDTVFSPEEGAQTDQIYSPVTHCLPSQRKRNKELHMGFKSTFTGNSSRFTKELQQWYREFSSTLHPASTNASSHPP
jgi:hypothetical protein